MSKSWRRWHERDPWRNKAQKEGYRSRAAFKLQAIQGKYRLIRKGNTVIDLGAAPGGWTQFALEKLGDTGQVVAVDLKGMPPLDDCLIVQGDATDPGVQARIVEEVGLADVVLSDMAPRISGAYSMDHARSIALAECALEACNGLLRPGGRFVAKVFQGDLFKPFYDEVGHRFHRVHGYKPPASRKASSETFVVGLRFKGPAGPVDVMQED